MNEKLLNLKAEVIADGKLTAEEVAAIEAVVMEDGKVSQGELTILFEINDACAEKDASWNVLLGKAAKNCLLNDSTSYKAIDESEADFLIAAFSKDGKLDSAELEVIRKIFESAESVDAKLVKYVMENIEAAVVADGVISDEEINTLAAVIYSKAGDESESVSKTEAELLFSINNKLPKKTYSWNKFFADVVADYILADGEVSDEEAEWLNAQISGDGTVDASEKALIDLLKTKATKISTNFKF